MFGDVYLLSESIESTGLSVRDVNINIDENERGRCQFDFHNDFFSVRKLEECIPTYSIRLLKTGLD